MKLNLESIWSLIRKPNPKVLGVPDYNMPKVSAVGMSTTIPDLANFNISDFKTGDLKAALENKHIDRNVTSVANLCFGQQDFRPVPPREFGNKNPDFVQDIRDKLYEFDKVWQLQDRQIVAFRDIWAYRYCFFEVLFGNIGKWWVPVYWEHLQAHTFYRAPSEFVGNERYVIDRILPGVVYDLDERRTRYFQTIKPSEDPIEIPAENLLVIRDTTRAASDSKSYLAELLDTLGSQNLSRFAMNQTVGRAAVPNAVFKAKRPQGALSMPGGESSDLTADYPAWEMADELSKLQGKDTRIVVPEDLLEIDWPDLKVALNPKEYDDYYIKEIVDHLVPLDVLKQMGTSLSKSSKELLQYLEMMVDAHRSHVGNQVYGFATLIMNLNGLEGWWLEPVYKNMRPSDKESDRSHSLEAYKAQAITTKRFYEETGRTPPTKEELTELYAEWALRRVSVVPALSGMSTKGEQQDVEALAIMLEAKRSGLMEVLKDFGYFDYLKRGR